MKRGIVVIVTVLLIGMAGCTASGIAVSPQSNETTPTPDEASNETFPPGTSASGIDNVTKLLETHRSVLNNSTYVERVHWDETTAVWDGNGNRSFRGFDVESYNTTVIKGSNVTYLTLDGENVSESYWVTDKTTTSKNTQYRGNHTWTTYSYIDDGRASQTSNQPRGFWMTEMAGTLLPKYLHGLDYEYAGTLNRNNDTLYKYTSAGRNETTQTNQRPTSFTSSVEHVNTTILIDQQGLIRTVNTSETHSRENETLTSGLNYSVRPTSGETPTKPKWVSTELPQLNASSSGNGTVIALEHTGGMPVSVGTFMISSDSVSGTSVFTGPFESGDTFYLYQTQNGTDHLNLSRNEHPEVTDSFRALGGENLSLTVERSVDESFGGGVTIRVEVKNGSVPEKSVSQ